jgi:membrane protein
VTVVKQRTRQPALDRWLRPIREIWAELTRVELVDRSLALGAQALLAVIPLLMVLGVASARIGAESLNQVQDVMGVPDDQLHQLTAGAAQSTSITSFGVVVAVVSATSFSRALQRMYALAWHLPRHRGMRAFRGSVVWLVVWLMTLQTTAGVIRWTADIPFTSLALQVLGTTMIWWWTAHLLLGGRVGWWRLLPGGVATGALLVLLSRLSHLFMPAYTRANLEQFGSLGIVFAVASWLVMFGGVLIVATVVGRFAGTVLSPAGEGPPTWSRRPLRPRG